MISEPFAITWRILAPKGIITGRKKEVERIQILTILNDSNEPHENKLEAPGRAEPFGRVHRYIGIGLPIAEESSPHHHSYGSVSGGSADPRDRHPIQNG